MSLETLSSTCTFFDDRRLWLGKITLRSRLVDLRGWHGVRRFRRQIRMEEVESVARAAEPKANLVLEMLDGSRHTLRVTAPGIWRMQIEYRLRRIAGADAQVGTAFAEPTAEVAAGIPTAEEVEEPSLEEAGAESLNDVFFDRELGGWPVFEEEQGVPDAGEDTETEGIETFVLSPVGLSVDTAAEPASDLLMSAEQSGDEVPTVVSEGPALVDELVVDRLPEEEPEIQVVAASEVISAPQIDAPDEPAVSREGSAAELPAAAAQPAPPVDLPPADALQEIGDDMVFGETMDPTSHEDVVMDWLLAPDEAPSGVRVRIVEPDRRPEDGEPVVPVDSGERVLADQPQLGAEPIAQIQEPASDIEVASEGMVAESLSGADALDVALPGTGDPAEATEPLSVARRPFRVSKLIEPAADAEPAAADPEPAPQAAEPEPAAADPEPAPQAAEPEPQASEPESVAHEFFAADDPEPSEAELLAAFSAPPSARDTVSLERRERPPRKPLESLAHLRPMSLAELIKESQPTWTRLAEMD